MKSDSKYIIPGRPGNEVRFKAVVRIKLDPRILVRNPVMFTVEVVTVVMLIVTIYSFS